MAKAVLASNSEPEELDGGDAKCDLPVSRGV
jgi:hypothetical protein